MLGRRPNSARLVRLTLATAAAGCALLVAGCPTDPYDNDDALNPCNQASQALAGCEYCSFCGAYVDPSLCDEEFERSARCVLDSDEPCAELAETTERALCARRRFRSR